MESLHWKNNKNLRLRAIHWPVEEPAAVIALAHGQGEHIERYAHMAQWFNERGAAVLGFDHQGHGKSDGKRGHAPSFDGLLDDIDLLTHEAAKRYPGVPIVLYGHSMGGGLVLSYAVRRKPTHLFAVVASAPWIELAFKAPAIKVMIGRLLCRLLPTLTLPNGLDVKHISRTPAVVDAYRNDPLVHDRISAAAGIFLLDGFKELLAFRGVLPCPTLIMHGTADKITSIEASRHFAGQVQGNIAHQSWPGLYHEIHNDPEQVEVFEYCFEWLNALSVSASEEEV
jgi:alpha-beta hydrolase superfamily lysophospholipase